MSSTMKSYVCRGAFVGLLLVWTFVTASIAHAEEKTILEIAKVNESYKNASLISGNWIVGVHMNAVASELNPTLYSRIPLDW